MNRIYAIVISAVLAASIPACANPPQAESNSVIGKVEGVFIREHHGLYIETSLVPGALRGKELWALVRFPDPVDGRPNGELAKIPAGVALRTGDVIEVSLRDNGGITSGPLPTVSRVVQRLPSEQRRAAELSE
jgi:hypothetical protein